MKEGCISNELHDSILYMIDGKGIDYNVLGEILVQETLLMSSSISCIFGKYFNPNTPMKMGDFITSFSSLLIDSINKNSPLE